MSRRVKKAKQRGAVRVSSTGRCSPVPAAATTLLASPNLVSRATANFALSTPPKRKEREGTGNFLMSPHGEGVKVLMEI
ncbi:hypothetical protein COLO4_06237 [Corchorus olitorius]|uniref:Uncharacterized protein n=1 Tax=Corchorus olitorius TaxID=93759 RepID=A0A1R3KNT8_9ROSI|nr:hypothetical protein COLO4_06237 [Corchorus olitorius]